MTCPGQSDGLRFGLLGALEVRRDGHLLALGGPRQRALLAVLLLHPNALLSTDRLIDRLWGRAAPANAVNALQVQVSRLRMTLAAGTETPGALVTCQSGYQLRVGAGELDAERFERLVQDGGRALAAGLPQRAAEQLRQALALWRGPALADVANESFLQADIAHLEELRIAALEERIEADLALGRHGAVIADLERLVAAEPLRERPRGQLMLALYRCGRQAEALAVYRRARETLVSELGLEPSPALADLERAILQHDRSVLAPSPAEHRPMPSPAEPERAPLPTALAAARATPFVPRAGELEYLHADGGLLDGGRRVMLMSGEAGVGKTRLAAELAGEARDAGWTVLYGRADEGAPIPYQPFVEALRDSLAVRPQLALHCERLGPELTALGEVVPGLRGLMPETADRPPKASPCGCERLFESLTAAIDALARCGPLLLVLDDLHWADGHTLLLLRHIVRSAQGSPLAVLGTFRDGEPGGHAPPLADLVVELRRDGTLDRVTLTGFDEAQTAAAVATRLPAGVDPGFVPSLRRVTGGNPFLIGEVMRELAGGGGGDPLPVPESVHGMVRRRLDRLGGRACEVLVAAAAIGQVFRLDVLESLFAGRPSAVLAGLERALTAQIIVEVPEQEDSFAFSPPLLREAICAIPSAARRRRLHRHIEEALGGEQAHQGLQVIDGIVAPALLAHAPLRLSGVARGVRPEGRAVSGLQGR